MGDRRSVLRWKTTLQSFALPGFFCGAWCCWSLGFGVQVFHDFFASYSGDDPSSLQRQNSGR